MAVSDVSYTKTPQAADDLYNFDEDWFNTNMGPGGSIFLDVMANDLGGKAKSLYSIDDGDNALQDILTRDPGLTTAWETTAEGNQIRINNGKIEFRFADGFDVNSLTEGQQYGDSFVYAIRLGNGTISYATVNIHITGSNDAASITATAGGDYAVVEAGGVANGTAGDPYASGDLDVADVDAGEAKFQSPASLEGTYGSFTFDAATGAWTYTLDDTRAATQALTAGQSASDSLTVTSYDGTASHTITVNITGANDAAVITGTDTGSVTEAGGGSAGVPTATGDLLATDVDGPDDVFQAVTTATASASGYGTYTVTAAGMWTYTLDNGNPAVEALNTGSTLNDSFVVYSADGTAKTVNITINGTTDAVNHAPTDIALSITNSPGGNTLPGAGTVLGTFSTADPDAGDSFTYSLLAGSSSGFGVSTSGTLTATAALAESSVYTINIQTQDAGGLSYQETFNIITGTNSGGGSSGDDNPLPAGGALNPILAGDDVIYGSGGNDVIFGGSGNDTIFGQNGTDTIYGGQGNDTLNGGNQSDRFVFLASDGGGVDTITNFSTSAPGSNGDILDISDLLIGYGAGSNINDFVQLTTSGGNTTLSVDRDGAGGSHGFQDVVILQGVTGLSVGALLANGNLDVTP